MRVRKPKKEEQEMPDELFTQPNFLEFLAAQQEKGHAYYGEFVYPPWKRQRKTGGSKALRRDSNFTHLSGSGTSGSNAKSVKANHGTSNYKQGAFTEKENRSILSERRKGTTWEQIARKIDRSVHKLKKHFHTKLKLRLTPAQALALGVTIPGMAGNNASGGASRPQAGPKSGQSGNASNSSAGKSATPSAARAAPAPTSASKPPAAPSASQAVVSELVPLEDLENKLYNKVVTVKGGRKMTNPDGVPQLYFVLNFNEAAGKCHLVPLMSDGHFSASEKCVLECPSLLGRRRYKLVPEGESEAQELIDYTSQDCTIVPSEAANKVSDADREAWQILDKRYQ